MSTQSTVVLTKVGAPMTRSLMFEELRDLDRDLLEASFSFKPLKSAKSGVD
jgi:hypothetical protein